MVRHGIMTTLGSASGVQRRVRQNSIIPQDYRRIPREMLTNTRGEEYLWGDEYDLSRRERRQRRACGIHSMLLPILARTPVPDTPDAELIAKWKAGDQDASFYLLCRHYRYILAKILDITNGEWFSDDILQAGAVGLYEAAKRYDSSRKNTFLTYAHYWILKFIYMEARNDLLPLGGLGVGRDSKERLFNYVKLSMYGLTDEEIRLELGLSTRTFYELKILSASASRIKSLDAVKVDSDDEDSESYNMKGVPTHQSAENEYLSNELLAYVEARINDLKASDPFLATFLKLELGVCGEYQRRKSEICSILSLTSGQYVHMRRRGNKYLRTQMISDGWYDTTKEEAVEAIKWFEHTIEEELLSSRIIDPQEVGERKKLGATQTTNSKRGRRRRKASNGTKSSVSREKSESETRSKSKITKATSKLVKTKTTSKTRLKKPKPKVKKTKSKWSSPEAEALCWPAWKRR